MHPNELSLKELKKIQKQLSVIKDKTPEIIKKLKVVEAQIKRQISEIGDIVEEDTITPNDNITKK